MSMDLVKFALSLATLGIAVLLHEYKNEVMSFAARLFPGNWYRVVICTDFTLLTAGDCSTTASHISLIRQENTRELSI